MQILDFEKSIAELETKIDDLRHISDGGNVDIAGEISRLQNNVEKHLQGIYSKLTAAQKVQVARHPERPQCLDYIEKLVEDFTPLAGDRAFAEDLAIIGGLGRWNGHPCMIIGQERGKDTDSRLKHNFGMAKPEGYRKAQRLMNLADRFNLPIITLVDTAGAYPGIDAEARGQAEAIARSIETCLNVGVPIVSCIIGEGGSGGAIAIATGDKVLMLEHSIYSVISPEGCATILWRSASNAAEAAEALRITAQDLLQLGIIDQIIAEPLGGAHRKRDETIKAVGEAVTAALEDLTSLDRKTLLAERKEKYLGMGSKGLG